MKDLVVRRARKDDLAGLASLIDEFARGHPAERRARSPMALEEAVFGPQQMAQVLVAERGSTLIGFGAWRKTYDFFWSLFGGDGLGLFVVPALRGHGVAAMIVAAMCAEIRQQGGGFLQTTYTAELAPLYERVAVGRAERACHVSALAFERLADLSGRPAREIVRELPGPDLNYVSAS